MLFFPISTEHIKYVPWGYVFLENIIINVIIFSSIYLIGTFGSGIQSESLTENNCVFTFFAKFLTEKANLKMTVTRIVAYFQLTYEVY